MHVVSALSVDDFERALKEARQLGFEGGPLPGLAAPLDAALTGRIKEAWATIESAVRQGWEKGKEQSRTALEAALARVQTLIDQAGERATELYEALLEKLRRLMQSLVDRALANIRDTIQVGATSLSLQGLQISQKVIIGGSLAGSIQELWELTSSGELEVAATYGPIR